LLVDVSNSMRYGRGALNKFDYACTIAASLAYLVLRQNDAVSCIAFDQKIRRTVPSRTHRTHLNSIVESLDVSNPADKTDLTGVLREVAETQPRRGLMIVISDLLADREGTQRGLRLLRQRGHDVLVFHVLDDDELDFPFNGATRFEGLETDDSLTCNPRALREGYLAALQAYLDETRRACAQQAIDYELLRTSQPLDAAIATFLSKRLGMRRSG
ncbi:MAG: VWA domain-containing protein, partial [Planctomycetales bacterium]|nr:VWA domain-containing protein [Planctomycetales bacterium]